MTHVIHIDRGAKGLRKVITAKPSDTVAAAAEVMSTHRIGCLVITDEREKIVGVLTERDIIRDVVGKCLDPMQTEIAQVMTRKVIVCSPNTPMDQAEQVMVKHGIRHMPIATDGKAVGMISSRDIFAHHLATAQMVANKRLNLLRDLESTHPGISQVARDASGRVVI